IEQLVQQPEGPAARRVYIECFGQCDGVLQRRRAGRPRRARKSLQWERVRVFGRDDHEARWLDGDRDEPPWTAWIATEEHTEPAVPGQPPGHAQHVSRRSG